MAKTNWQDPKTSEVRSTHISGLQEAVGKLEESIGIETISETNIPLSEVFISNDDRCRIYQAPEGKRNWLLSPTPSIKKNGVIITDDFEIDYGGGAIIFTTPILETDTVSADVTYTKKVEGKGLSTNDYTNGEKQKNQNNAEKILQLSESLFELEHSELSSIATNIDDEGVYQNVAWKRKDGTLYAKSSLIGTYPYNQIKIDYYDEPGTTIIKTITWDLSYDDNDFPYARMVV